MQRLMFSIALGLFVTLVALSGVPRSEAGGGACHRPHSEAVGDQVDIVEGCFGPTLLFAQPGASVQWVNRDVMPHNVVSAGMAWGEGKPFESNKTVAFKFDAEGIYPYFCSMHPSMVGVVVVGDPTGEPMTAAQQAAVARAPTRPAWTENSAVYFGESYSPTAGPPPAWGKGSERSSEVSPLFVGGAAFIAGSVVAGSLGVVRGSRRV